MIRILSVSRYKIVYLFKRHVREGMRYTIILENESNMI